MSVEIVTKEDLEAFRVRILEDIKGLLANPSAGLSVPVKPLLRPSAVKKLLGISEGSLQHLRDSGQLKAKKIGGVYRYRPDDIDKYINTLERR